MAIIKIPILRSSQLQSLRMSFRTEILVHSEVVSKSVVLQLAGLPLRYYYR